MKDVSPKVEITIRLEFENCEYPEPTRETIRNKLREMLGTNFAYSEKRYPLSEPFEVQNNIITARFNEQRKAPSKETYGVDADPFNE